LVGAALLCGAGFSLRRTSVRLFRSTRIIGNQAPGESGQLDSPDAFDTAEITVERRDPFDAVCNITCDGRSGEAPVTAFSEWRVNRQQFENKRSSGSRPFIPSVG
jgi:hypothetical protein